MEAAKTVIALAGRRPDPAEAGVVRFPATKVNSVSERLRAAMLAVEASTLVCAAAAGADLLAISVAEELGIAQEIVLPLPEEVFRRYSVADRPGEWGTLFDAAIARAKDVNRMVALSGEPGTSAYRAGNEAILDRAEVLAGEGQKVVCVAVWNMTPRGEGDITKAFLDSAARRGMRIIEVSTL